MPESGSRLRGGPETQSKKADKTSRLKKRSDVESLQVRKKERNPRENGKVANLNVQVVAELQGTGLVTTNDARQ